eukprot:m.69543 g.69543  ORF g.69543 m.69543 type:complete len:51 (-) comp12226_c1_seq2:334-486(-)
MYPAYVQTLLSVWPVSATLSTARALISCLNMFRTVVSTMKGIMRLLVHKR